jgi:molecular chaperone GrpE
VRRELLTALAKHGVTPVDALGKPFDPALHEALAQVPDESVAPNTVVQELQKGYQLRDRLLRPTRVVVSRAPDQASQPERTADPGDAPD